MSRCACGLESKDDATASTVPSPRRRRQRRRRRPATVSSLLLASLSLSSSWRSTDHTAVVSAFVMPFQSQGRSTSGIAQSQLYSSTTDSDLGQLTVKELRERVKEVCTERGIVSKLKRKQDLIQYLSSQTQPKQQQQNSHNQADKGSSDKRAAPQQMPRLVVQQESEEALHPRMNGKKKSASSPKQASFERVYRRYPVLRESPTDFANNDDIRQWQHPIYRHNNVTTSDMDVVFVGTASCTPGITRGVSCTALRLHWRRQTTEWKDGRLETTGGSSTGGTWLFDVGECTQVSSMYCSAVS